MPKFFYDTEFIEAGPTKPIQLVSIGMVSETGHTFYAISSEFNPDDASDWVKKNVLAKLEPESQVSRQKLSEIAAALIAFVNSATAEILPAAGQDLSPKFYGYYADYDHVCLCQLHGTMMDLPKGWPMFTRDLIQTAKEIQARHGLDIIAALGQPKGEHNALLDAQWNKALFEALDRTLNITAAQVAKLAGSAAPTPAPAAAAPVAAPPKA